jgi:hypothetical protein
LGHPTVVAQYKIAPPHPLLPHDAYGSPACLPCGDLRPLPLLPHACLYAPAPPSAHGCGGTPVVLPPTANCLAASPRPPLYLREARRSSPTIAAPNSETLTRLGPITTAPINLLGSLPCTARPAPGLHHRHHRRPSSTNSDSSRLRQLSHSEEDGVIGPGCGRTGHALHA